MSDAKKYIREGPLMEISDESEVPRYVFLFSNMLIVSKSKKSIFKGKDTFTTCSYQYELPLHEGATISNLEDSDGTLQLQL